MNSNKISCQKNVFNQDKYNSSPILKLSDIFASQICHENTNTPLDGAYLADFGIDITFNKPSARPWLQGGLTCGISREQFDKFLD